MASIHEPTGPELALIFPMSAGDGNPLSGILDPDRIDAYRASKGQRSVVYEAYDHVKGIIEAANLNPNSLTQNQANRAQSAIEWISIVELSRLDRGQQPRGGKDCEKEEDYQMRIREYQLNACMALDEISLTSEKYCTLPGKLVRGEKLEYCP